MPKRVRNFAEAVGRLAKNDRADAAVIAHATAVLGVKPRGRRARALDPVVELLAYRRCLVRWKMDCSQALERLKTPRSRRAIELRRARLKLEIVASEKKLADMLKAGAGDDLAHRLAVVPGVGPVLLATLMASLPELGSLTGGKSRAWSGLRRLIATAASAMASAISGVGGKKVRDVLYMAAVSEMRCNPVIAAFAKRLDHKPPKVAITACMRKLLTILNAMARDNAAWEVRTVRTT